MAEREKWLAEIESACNAALLDIYDLSIANAPMPAKDCRNIADCIGHRVGQVREAIAALRSLPDPPEVKD